MEHPVYLDHAATTRPDEKVLQIMAETARNCWANPSSAYSSARDARRILLAGRRAAAELIGGDGSGIVFTSGGTESNALALHQAAGKHVVISAIEHSSVTEAARAANCDITIVYPGSDGVLTPEAVEAAIRPDTALVSVQFANNETGVLQPIREIGAITRSKRVLLHCDAVQGYGQMKIDVEELGIDLLSASGHKIYGPRGVGILYFGSRVVPKALIPGSQETGIRGGTENIPAIAGFTAAAELAAAEMAHRAEHERKLQRLLRQLLAKNDRILFPGASAERLPGFVSIILPETGSEEAISRLDSAGILVSGGAACATGLTGGSHVLWAMGYSPGEAGRALRISIGRENTEEEIRAAAEAILGICG